MYVSRCLPVLLHPNYYVGTVNMAYDEKWRSLSLQRVIHIPVIVI